LSSHKELYFVFIGKDGGNRGGPMIEHVWEKAGFFRDRVIYFGQLRHRQLYPILARSTAVVLPSRIDNLPNACLEAMALKRVVIGTRGASFEQLIEDGVNGFLCPPDNPENLFATIEKVLTLADSEMENIGQKAVDRIEVMRPNKAVRQLVDFYETVISG
jgi:glycogen synthase